MALASHWRVAEYETEDAIDRQPLQNAKSVSANYIDSSDDDDSCSRAGSPVSSSSMRRSPSDPRYRASLPWSMRTSPLSGARRSHPAEEQAALVDRQLREEAQTWREERGPVTAVQPPQHSPAQGPPDGAAEMLALGRSDSAAPCPHPAGYGRTTSVLSGQMQLEPGLKSPQQLESEAKAAMDEALRRQRQKFDNVPMSVYTAVEALLKYTQRALADREELIQQGNRARDVLLEEQARLRNYLTVCLDKNAPEVKELRQRHQEVVSVRDHQAELIRNYEKRVKMLREEVMDMRRNESRSANVLAVCEEALLAARTTSVAQAEERAQLAAAVASKDSEIAQLKQRLEEKGREVEAVQIAGAQMVKDKHDEMLARDKATSSILDREAELQAKVKCGDDIISELRQRLRDWEVQLEEKEAELYAAQTRLAKEHEEVVRGQRQCAALEDELAARDDVYQQRMRLLRQNASGALACQAYRQHMRSRFERLRMAAQCCREQREHERLFRRSESESSAAWAQRDEVARQLAELQEALAEREAHCQQQLDDAMRIREAADRIVLDNENYRQELGDLMQFRSDTRIGRTPEQMHVIEQFERDRIKTEEEAKLLTLLQEVRTTEHAITLCDRLDLVASKVEEQAELGAMDSPRFAAARRKEIELRAQQREQELLRRRSSFALTGTQPRTPQAPPSIEVGGTLLVSPPQRRIWGSPRRECSQTSASVQDEYAQRTAAAQRVELQREQMMEKAAARLQDITDRLERKRLAELESLKRAHDEERRVTEIEHQRRLSEVLDALNRATEVSAEEVRRREATEDQLRQAEERLKATAREGAEFVKRRQRRALRVSHCMHSVARQRQQRCMLELAARVIRRLRRRVRPDLIAAMARCCAAHLAWRYLWRLAKACYRRRARRRHEVVIQYLATGASRTVRMRFWPRFFYRTLGRNVERLREHMEATERAKQETAAVQRMLDAERRARVEADRAGEMAARRAESADAAAVAITAQLRAAQGETQRLGNERSVVAAAAHHLGWGRDEPRAGPRLQSWRRRRAQLVAPTLLRLVLYGRGLLRRYWDRLLGFRNLRRAEAAREISRKATEQDWQGLILRSVGHLVPEADSVRLGASAAARLALTEVQRLWAARQGSEPDRAAEAAAAQRQRAAVKDLEAELAELRGELAWKTHRIRLLQDTVEGARAAPAPRRAPDAVSSRLKGVVLSPARRR